MATVCTAVFDSAALRDLEALLGTSVRLHLWHDITFVPSLNDENAQITKMVGTGGIEPPTPSTSRKCSPTELRAFKRSQAAHFEARGKLSVPLRTVNEKVWLILE